SGRAARCMGCQQSTQSIPRQARSTPISSSTRWAAEPPRPPGSRRSVGVRWTSARKTARSSITAATTAYATAKRSRMARGSPARGVVRAGDAVCDTGPAASLGLSFALVHARLLAAAIRDSGWDMEAVALAFDALARPEMDERFAYVSAIDDTRHRLWAGESID